MSSAHSPAPLVTVGVPVYNGQRFLRRALDSLLNSDYPNLEVIICDNGSSDDTADIAASYVKRDNRFRHYRSDLNLGAAPNFNRAFHLASGQYFRWLAHDDWCSPEYDSRCVDILERIPSAVLAFAAQNVVDENGAVLQTTRQALGRADDRRASARVRSLAWRLRDPTAPVFGLIRRDVLSRTKLIRSTPEPDRLLVHELALHGKLMMIDEPLFFHYRSRGHALHYGESADVRRRSFEWLHPDNRGKRQLTTLRVLLEHWTAVERAELSRRETFMCSMHILGASAVKRPVAKWRQTRSRQRAILRLN